MHSLCPPEVPSVVSMVTAVVATLMFTTDDVVVVVAVLVSFDSSSLLGTENVSRKVQGALQSSI